MLSLRLAFRSVFFLLHLVLSRAVSSLLPIGDVRKVQELRWLDLLTFNFNTISQFRIPNSEIRSTNSSRDNIR